MVSVGEARKLAMEFPETKEAPHFEKASFRIQGKKIFMTMKEDEDYAVLMLTPEDQAVFTSSPDKSMYPHPSKWGLKGCTVVNLKKVKKGLLKDAMKVAWLTNAPKKFAQLHFPDETSIF